MAVKIAYPPLTAVLHGLVLSRPGGLDAETVAGLKRQCDEAGVPFFDKSKKPLSRDLPWAVRK